MGVLGLFTRGPLQLAESIRAQGRDKTIDYHRWNNIASNPLVCNGCNLATFSKDCDFAQLAFWPLGHYQCRSLEHRVATGRLYQERSA